MLAIIVSLTIARLSCIHIHMPLCCCCPQQQCSKRGTVCEVYTVLRAALSTAALHRFPFSACSAFKQFLELEPQVREVVQQFYNSKYAACLRTLDQMRVRTACVASASAVRVVEVHRSDGTVLCTSKCQWHLSLCLHSLSPP